MPSTSGRSHKTLLSGKRSTDTATRVLLSCFHLPSLDNPGYLAKLHSELKAAQVEMFSLLIDEGDIVLSLAQRRAGKDFGIDDIARGTLRVGNNLVENIRKLKFILVA